MKLSGANPSGWSPTTMSRSEENAAWLVSISTMSLNLVIDQNGPVGPVGDQWTGSS